MISCYKGLLTLLTLFCANTTFAQSANSAYDVGTYKADHFIDSSGTLKKHLLMRFSLPQSVADTYQIDIFDDSLSTLSIKENEKYRQLYVLDSNIQIDVPEELPAFVLTDFNNDGYYDLSCWMSTNANGNRWTELFLYDPVVKRLKVLENTAEEGTIWDAPEYNKRDKTIACTRIAGVFGYSFESKYKLLNGKAIPLSKKVDDRTNMDNAGNGEIREKYIGYKQQWKLVKMTVIKKAGITE